MNATFDAQTPIRNRLALVSLITSLVGWFFLLANICLQVISGFLAVVTAGVGLFLYCCLLPVTCLPPILWIVGAITGFVAQKQISETGQEGASKAKAGLVMGIVGLVASVLLVILIVVLSLVGVSLPFMQNYQF